MPAVPSSPRVKLRSTSRRVPRTRTGEAADQAPEFDSEPTMRLSRAILVMLLLHVVAVGGFIVSSHLRERDLRSASGDPAAAVEADDSLSPAKGADARAKADATAPPRPAVHVVRQGETLMRIANDHGVTLAALVAANGAETVTAPLHPGQELKLPALSPDPSTQVADGTASALSLIEGKPSSATSKISTPSSLSGSSAKNLPPPPDSGKAYVVGKGENIYTIAQKLKVSPESLLRLNQIDDPKKLKPGQKLRVPSALKAKGKP